LIVSIGLGRGVEQLACIEIDVITADTSSDTDLKVLCFFDQITSEVSRVEGSRDNDLGLVNGQALVMVNAVGILHPPDVSGSRCRAPLCCRRQRTRVLGSQAIGEYQAADDEGQLK
jgi:hypothetical protein